MQNQGQQFGTPMSPMGNGAGVGTPMNSGTPVVPGGIVPRPINNMATNVAVKIEQSSNILVALSKDPSVDEISAALGLTMLLDSMGKHVTAIYSGKTPNVIRFLKPEKTFETNANSLQDFIIALNKDKADHLRYKVDGDFVKVYITPYKTTITERDLEFSHGDFNVDLVISLGVETEGELDAALAEHGRIMHDAGSINITIEPSGKFAEMEWSEPGASSVCEMITKLTEQFRNCPALTQEVATALLTGIVSNTDRFMNEKTTPEVMGVASKLMQAGANQMLISMNISKDKGPMKMGVQKDEEKSYEFLTEELPNLPDWVDVFYSDAFANRPVRPMPKVTAGVSVNDSNLLEVSFNAKDLDFNELMEILDSYRQKRKYHRLKDKSFITLGDQQMQAIADFVDNTGIDKAQADGMKVELPMSQAMYLDELAREDEALRLERSRAFRAIVRDIRHPEDSEVEVPASLKGVLRDYQVTGFNWLSNLSAYHLGGILADDMGLGKTLQVITFLLAKQNYQEPPSLVVAPTSLMYNWLEEIERFAPQLKAAAVAGTKAEREKILAEADASYDVLITTYNMLKRDIAMYEKRRFRYAFLDEAQHIKNPTTQNARAVKKLKTSGYFALTGTPIENTLTELWSIFDFLMPGYLLSHKKFKDRYETPIVREQDERSLKDLKRHVMPFILRRMKKDVLTELPDKVERKMVSSMTPKQEKVYQGWFLKSQKEFAEQMAAGEDSRIKILAILTRLRQIACDPAMFLEGYTGGSGKLDQLEEVVSDAVEGGHRILIFSQFTTMLAHIGERLKQQGIAYYYLDGSTPSLERIRLVKAFNEGTTPVFLISLKAGGTGLNLTGADMVIHFDPWWNPAVEDQATDRAYRLGQKNNVQVIRLLAKGTVEEKIYELQQKKKSLIDQMIQPGENFLSKLTDEEIRELFQK